MGHAISIWWWGGEPDQPNPISGLTIRQVHHIQCTWKAIHADEAKYGMELFIRLFRADPESKNLFKAIRNLDEAEIRGSYQFKAHALNFMSALNLGVANLTQPEVVVAMMEKLGDSHAKRHITPRQFDVTKEVLVGMLKNDLKLSEEQMQAWGAFIRFIYKHILDKL